MISSFEEENAYPSQLGSSAIKQHTAFAKEKKIEEKEKRKGAFTLFFSSKPIFQMGVTEEEMYAFIQMIIAVKQPPIRYFPLCTESLICHFHLPLQNHYSCLFPFPEKVSNAFILSFKLT